MTGQLVAKRLQRLETEARWVARMCAALALIIVAWQLVGCGSAQPVTTACRVRAVTCEACERVCEASEGLCDAAAEVDPVPPSGGDIFEE